MRRSTRKRGFDAGAAARRARAAPARLDRAHRLLPLVLCWLLVPACDGFEPPDDPHCFHDELTLQIHARPVERLDLLIWIDDSPSMVEEQAALAAQLPAMLRDLLTPPDLDGDTRPEWPEVEDLHVGVVAPGAPTTSPLPGCLGPEGSGGGCLLRDPPVAATGCSATYPPFQAWDSRRDDAADAERIADDLACVASVGTAGCPYAQPFASVLRALTVEAGAGGCNEGFLRDDASLLVLFVSDGDDGSASAAHPELFDPDAPLGPPELRAALQPELLEPVPAVAAALRAALPDRARYRIMLGMVVGVPPDSPMCLGPGDCLEGCLARPEMTVALDPADPTRLVPSCSTTQATAAPPRRFVELARSFGSSAAVVSICGTDWSHALSPATYRPLEPWQENVCLHRDLPLAEGECVPDCGVVETLDDDRPCPEDPECPAAWCPEATAGDLPDLTPCVEPTTGGECRPYKRDLGLVTGDDGVARRQCLVRAAARAWDPATGTCGWPEEHGWFYRPAEESPAACAALMFHYEGYGGGLESGSRAEVRCGWTTCEGDDAGSTD
ncbi:MAG: hypothetical protein JXB32_06510 [Deltaproteobacteria bacterium]|nr:hypothetical protein [Deltaproteobacteria bacterium]